MSYKKFEPGLEKEQREQKEKQKAKEEKNVSYTVEPFVKDEPPPQQEKPKTEPSPEQKVDAKPETKQKDQNNVKNGLADEYLNMARVIQADFDNYRKRSAENMRQAKIDGTIEALEIFIPCLDVFKKAKDMITDENSKKGIEMLENEILSSLKNIGVEKIETVGKQFDPNIHHCLMVMEDKTKPDNVVLDEYQAGYKYKDKIIKYSQVIVNKLKEEK